MAKKGKRRQGPGANNEPLPIEDHLLTIREAAEVLRSPHALCGNTSAVESLKAGSSADDGASDGRLDAFYENAPSHYPRISDLKLGDKGVEDIRRLCSCVNQALGSLSEVDTQWVRAKISPFNSPSTGFCASISKDRG